ncbi:MAG: ATP-binding protein, partial [Bacteroidota bacterium]
YIQFVKYDGNNLSEDILFEKKFSGDFITMLRSLESFIESQIKERPVPDGVLREKQIRNYPAWAIRELLMNAIMHRDYQSNAPIRFYWFDNHIEIQNPGGLFGTARPENFPQQNDYRNPVIAEVLKTLGYVNRFSRGIFRAKKLLGDNGNGEPEFVINQPTYFNVKIKENAI